MVLARSAWVKKRFAADWQRGEAGGVEGSSSCSSSCSSRKKAGAAGGQAVGGGGGRPPRKFAPLAFVVSAVECQALEGVRAADGSRPRLFPHPAYTEVPELRTLVRSSAALLQGVEPRAGARLLDERLAAAERARREEEMMDGDGDAAEDAAHTVSGMMRALQEVPASEWDSIIPRPEKWGVRKMEYKEAVSRLTYSQVIEKFTNWERRQKKRPPPDARGGSGKRKLSEARASDERIGAGPTGRRGRSSGRGSMPSSWSAKR